MSLIRVGMQTVDARPHVEAAIQALGTIRRDQTEAFLTAFVETFLNGSRGYVMRCYGRRLTPEELETAGIAPGLRVSAEALAMLTSKGRHDVIRAFDDVMLEAWRGIQQEAEEMAAKPKTRED